MDMSESLDPLAATEGIETAYRRYLRSTMRTNDPNLDTAIAAAFNKMQRPLIQGPILESSPPFSAGRPVSALVKAGLLAPDWVQYDFHGQVFTDRPLYLHQDEAICRVVGEQRNVVVATGTGSGKTETFLIPIIETLFRQRAAGMVIPGVRALLLYPMNALANDQLRRLRELLRDVPAITFGRYTGETPETRQQGIAVLEAAEGDVAVLSNELLGREEMRATPPDILLTNYAMMEYLLLRPDDSPLFNPTGEDGWKFLVLDEVHTYDGTKGIELGMLVRRLLNRVRRGPGGIQCILTSATIGGPGDRAAVARFASALTGLPFEWDDSNEREQDVVVATRERHPLPLPDPDADLDAIVGSSEASELQASALAADARIQRLLDRVWERPASIEDLISAVSSPGQAVEPATVTRLVQRLSKLRVPGTETPFLRARFHTFVRAIDGADVCMRPHPDGLPRVFLEPQHHCPDCGDAALVAELATCRRCAQWHLRGIVGHDDRLERAPDREDSDEKVCYVAPRTDIDFNEDRGAGEDEAEPGLFGSGETEDKQVSFCLNCLSVGTGLDCCISALKQPYVFASRTKGGAVRCVSCGAPATQSGPRRLRLGTDAPPAVVASALYDAMPQGVGAKRPRFLSFADSRQDAAFFAPYLERTYSSVARRRVLFAAIGATWREVEEGEGVRPQDVIAPARRLADSQAFFSQSVSPLAQTKTIHAWILSELTAMDRRQSLAGVGLVSRRLVRPPNWDAPSPLLQQPWSLSSDEAWHVIEALLKTLLDDQAIAFPDGVDSSDEIFSPRNKELGFRQLERARAAGIEIMPWAPAHGANARSDYLDRLLQRLQEGLSKEARRAQVEFVLEGLWRLVSKRDGPLSGYLSQTNHPRHGPYFQLSPDFWEFARPRGLVDCDRCGLIEHAAVRDVCPSYRCTGRMRPMSEPPPESHYRALYLGPGRGSLVAQEHTAQWSATEAARIQGEFVRDEGSINVLSCSTTFELGVDVGDLQSVLLRNVPPTAANYVQRAGRAGRRDETVGFIVTFAQLRPHDTQAFDHAEDLVAGKVPVPRIPASNERIVRRHVHSMALSRFLRHHVANWQEWRRVGLFFVGSTRDERTPCESFRNFLADQDTQLGEEVAQVVPAELRAELGLATWEWAVELAGLDPTRSPLALAEGQIKADVQAYNELYEIARTEGRGHDMERYRRVLNTVREADLIGSLAGSNVLPKYGFPVDVVPLKTAHLTTPEARSVQLDRDLRMAVSEFAPGSGVVAAKKLWVSDGLQLFPNKALPERDYAICRPCNRYYEGAGVASCAQCGQRLDGGRGNSRGKLVRPVFGFVARDPNVRLLGEERPRRLYSTRVLFQDYEKPSPREPIDGVSNTILGRFTHTGRLAVVNTGRDRHFQLCHTCGFARLKGVGGEHRHPVSRRACSGTLVVVDLGHSFSSDIAEFEFPALGPMDERLRASLLAALLEGARRLLAVSSDDLAALCYVDRIAPVFAIYDNVPGGAGLAREVHARIDDVLDAAQRLCDECRCGDNSSCYGCLRGYRNQYEHELLDRTVASRALAVIREGRLPVVVPD